jgi:hypothetical protein
MRHLESSLDGGEHNKLGTIPAIELQALHGFSACARPDRFYPRGLVTSLVKKTPTGNRTPCSWTPYYTRSPRLPSPILQRSAYNISSHRDGRHRDKDQTQAKRPKTR